MSLYLLRPLLFRQANRQKLCGFAGWMGNATRRWSVRGGIPTLMSTFTYRDVEMGIFGQVK